MTVSMAVRSFLVLLAVSATAVQAGEARQRLDQFFGGLSTLRAEFVQTVRSEDSPADESRGTLLVARPGKFRLHYEAPYEQLYVADGKRVWLYDKDLAQVTVKGQREALGSTPALLLSSTEPLDRNFSVSEPGAREGLAWVELRPHQEDAGFESVQLGLSGGTLKVMEMVDGLGQRTRIEFRKLERNVKIESSKFRFTPPAGVDVVGEDE
jgi:outer membrane lipoprotein carrier protein